MVHKTGSEIRAEIRFKALVFDMLVDWNHLESVARFMLEKLVGAETYRTQMLTSLLSGAQIERPLRALGRALDHDLNCHIQKFVEGCERLRGWRNYLVHGLRGVVKEQDECVGYTSEIKLKKNLDCRQETIKIERLSEVIHQLNAYATYGAGIIGKLYEEAGEVSDVPFPNLDHLGSIELPEKIEGWGTWFASHNLRNSDAGVGAPD